MPMAELTPHQTVFALLTALVTLALVLELVRRRKLREEYSWLWLLTAGAMLLLVVWYRLLIAMTRLVGAVTPLNTLLVFAILFLFAIAVHYSMIISRLAAQVKNLAQELALLSAQLDERRAPGAGEGRAGGR
ncbi:MAG TPA: DUF2304 domain-containing protein [Methylomirabilota bacterium]|nr:DUF2304 domain-containing protein [Methylomirabilota bacterium]